MRITNHVIQTALAASAAGKRYDVTDSYVAGLQLRVGKRIVWSVRTTVAGKPKRFEIGSVPHDHVDVARDRAREVVRIARSGQDPTPVVRQMTGDVFEFEETNDNQQSELWTYKQAVDAYLDDIKVRPDTLNDYRKILLSTNEFKEFYDLKLIDVTPKLLSTAIRSIAKRGHTAAKNSLGRFKTFSKWAADVERSDRSGMTVGYYSAVSVPPRLVVEIGSPEETDEARQLTHIPTLEEVGRIVAIARSGALSSNVSAAVLLTVYSLQRRRAVCSAKQADFRSDDGWVYWSMKPYFRKTARRRRSESNHVVPIFKGISTNFENIDVSTLTHVFENMPGVKASPHKIRAVFSTRMRVHADKDTDKHLKKLILDHMEGSKQDDVTEQHYDFDDRMIEKKEIMEKWISLVEQATTDSIKKDPNLLDAAYLKSEMNRIRKSKLA